MITRYGFAHLPRPPQQVWLSVVAWDWGSMTETRFRTLLGNYGSFMAANSQPGSPYACLFSLLKLTHHSAGQIVLVTQVSDGDESMLESFLAQITQGVGSPVAQARPAGAEQTILGSAANRLMPWLQATQMLNGSGPNQRGKYKSAYMITPFPTGQVTAIYAALTDPSYDNPQALLQVDSYGCQINARKPDATAVPQRSSIMKLQYQTYWTDPADDDANLTWIPPLLSERLCRQRRYAGAQRRHRRLLRELSRRGSPELHHALLQAELPSAAKSKGTVGPDQHLQLQSVNPSPLSDKLQRELQPHAKRSHLATGRKRLQLTACVAAHRLTRYARDS